MAADDVATLCFVVRAGVMRVLDLFSGIGGFSLGLERAGMRTVQFVELDPFCRAVLAQHWPDVPCHDDIRTFHAPAGFADVICGGFPCQDISIAGKGAGLAGPRSSLWTEYARLIGEVRPRFVVVENVAALLGRGLGDVLGDLAAVGYDAEWHCVPASAVGAPHRRDRVWIVAYPERWSSRGDGPAVELSGAARADQGAEEERQRLRADARYGCAVVAHANSEPQDGATESRRELHHWSVEPDVGRVADGVPARMDRLRSLGNAVVPQIPEIIGRAIMRASHGSSGSPK